MLAPFGLIARFFSLSSLPCARKAAAAAQNNHKITAKNRKTNLMSTASRACSHDGNCFHLKRFLCRFTGVKQENSSRHGANQAPKKRRLTLCAHTLVKKKQEGRAGA
jgi:hypothetical protein